MSDLISRQAVNALVDELARAISDERCFMSRGRSTASIMQDILNLPAYSFPDSANIEKIRAEIAEIPKKYPMTADYESGIREALSIVDKHIGGKDK